MSLSFFVSDKDHVSALFVSGWMCRVYYSHGLIK